MSASSHPRRVAAIVALCLWAATGAVPRQAHAGESAKRTLRFAADMARAGNWREAQFRWEALAREDPDNPRLWNNLAVAAEALGDSEAARAHYDRALVLLPGDRRIEDNVQRFERFWRRVASSAGAEIPDDPRSADRDADRAVRAPGKGKPLKVTVNLPVPPRLELGKARSLLVADFLHEDSVLLDVDHELIRFLRNKLQKSALDVLPVNPAPAVPEQTLDDLIANGEFWRHLGQEYDADLIVSGAVEFSRRDASGFRDTDRVSQSTGQKVRSTEFVEQEQFSYALELIVMDGASGQLRFRDRLQRSVVYRGTENDPISAFFEISEAMAPDISAIVSPRRRADPRIVFKN